MLKKIGALGVLLMIVAGLAACGTSGGDNASTGEGSATIAAAGPSTAGTVVTLNDDYADALPVSSQLVIGTFMLEGTEDAVTVEQAGELLPNWQMLQALQSSGTAAEAELDAVLNQIQGAMTDEQLTTIKEMQLTLDSMMELVQEQGLRMGAAAGSGRSGTVQPPAGVDMGGAGGPGGQFGAGGAFGAGGGTDLTPKEQEAAMAERMNSLAGTAMTGMVVPLLEARTEGETWEIAAPNQETVLQGELFAVIAEATGLDQQEIVTQARGGQTLLAIAEANSADVDEIVAQVVAADTERINQAVADGSLEQAEVDQWLAGLEAQVKEMLEGTLQFGSRDASGS
jgi:hypothetical protein